MERRDVGPALLAAAVRASILAKAPRRTTAAVAAAVAAMVFKPSPAAAGEHSDAPSSAAGTVPAGTDVRASRIAARRRRRAAKQLRKANVSCGMEVDVAPAGAQVGEPPADRLPLLLTSACAGAAAPPPLCTAVSQPAATASSTPTLFSQLGASGSSGSAAGPSLTAVRDLLVHEEESLKVETVARSHPTRSAAAGRRVRAALGTMDVDGLRNLCLEAGISRSGGKGKLVERLAPLCRDASFCKATNSWSFTRVE